MWLITYSQRSSHRDIEIIANAMALKGETVTQWLIRMMQLYPAADTNLLFAIEVSDVEGEKLNDYI